MKDRRLAIARHGETDTGRKRRRNEDSFVCDPPLFAVADGMGGAQAGELASSLAAAALRERPTATAGGEAAGRRAGPGGEPPRPPARDRRRVRLGDGHDDDGRALRGGRPVDYRPRRRLARLHPPRRHLEQLTDDHSLVAELVRRGELSPRRGRGPSAALRDHARARHRPGRRRRHVHGPAAARRRLPALLGRADDDGRRRRDRRARAAEPRRPATRREGADPRGEPRRRRRQHHGRPLPASTSSRSPPRASPTSRLGDSRLCPATRKTRSTPRTASRRPRRPSRRRRLSTRWSSPPTTSRRRLPSMRRRSRAPGGPRPAVARAARDRRADRHHRRARLVGACPLTQLSLRNRELFYLGVVGILTGLGFASPSTSRVRQPSAGARSATRSSSSRSTSRRTSSRGRRSRTPTRTSCRWPAS